MIKIERMSFDTIIKKLEKDKTKKFKRLGWDEGDYLTYHFGAIIKYTKKKDRGDYYTFKFEDYIAKDWVEVEEK